MTSAKAIEAILNRYGRSLASLPGTYKNSQRKAVLDVFHEWHGSGAKNSNIADFVCHQSDIIELLIECLKDCR